MLAPELQAPRALAELTPQEDFRQRHALPQFPRAPPPPSVSRWRGCHLPQRGSFGLCSNENLPLWGRWQPVGLTEGARSHFPHRNFKVDKPISASTIATIQKRITTLLSLQPSCSK